MDAINPFKTTGWKKAAKVNCMILVLLSVAMIILSSIALFHGAQTAIFLYSGDCISGKATAINLALHLVINVVSTLVALNSPSRDEIDQAHSRGLWLDIGVSSIRNTLKLPSVLALSSIPIHLLFNSTVFKTDYRGGASLQFLGMSLHSLIGSKASDHCSSILGPWAYGFLVNSSEYHGDSSLALRELSALATEAGEWKRLNINECRQEYASCKGLKEYSNVILVAEKPGGWVRGDMWDLGEDETRFWDKHIPQNRPTIYFSTLRCSPSMHFALSEPQPSALDISVAYCLAQPLASTCKVDVSPILLLLVTIFVVLKTSTATFITISLSRPRQVPLITPGDAIASFINSPDTTTHGYCTMGHEGIQKVPKSEIVSHSPIPRPWHGSQKRWAAAIPWSAWVISYLSITIGIGATVGLFAMAVHGALQDSSDITRGGFFPSDNSPVITLPFTLITAVLLANSPQLLLTFSYLAYNNIFTHLQSAIEWAKFGNTFSPLRVTDPKGEQISKYRLQLPYKYSLLLIAFRYYWYDISLRDASLPPDAAILVGYSPTALLTLMLVAIFLALIPPIWSSIRRLPLNIVVPGCNSLALSAACHVSRLSHDTAKIGAPGDTTSPSSLASSMPRSSSNADSSMRDTQLEKSHQPHLENLAQRKLRWGVIDMPPEWYTEHGYDPALVGHLGFGTLEGGGVAAPLWRHLYA
ncbi:hypothetical protein HD806DRAFT_547722 [Xylariaceae sp. AK1471]|nr:hypothetical protein HD806DRAFT_547722 [Xylariaceae sp. AK1471]